jgi:hypothetical protein
MPKTKRIPLSSLTKGTEVLALVHQGVTFSGKVTDYSQGRHVFLRLGNHNYTFEMPPSTLVEVVIPDLAAIFDAFPLGQVFSSSGNGTVKYIKVGRRAFIAETSAAAQRAQTTLYSVDELNNQDLVFTPIG